MRGAKHSDIRRYREHLQRRSAPVSRGQRGAISLTQWTSDPDRGAAVYDVLLIDVGPIGDEPLGSFETAVRGGERKRGPVDGGGHLLQLCQHLLDRRFIF